VGALPLVEDWPLLPNHQIHMDRLAQFGVIEIEEVLDAMRQCPRGVHALPFPLDDEMNNLEASSLRMPWCADIDMHHSLLPGLFETCQIMQLLQLNKGDSVLLLGPRGNWWTELMMYIGAQRIVVLEPDEGRREILTQRWDDLRLDIVANAFGCQIEMVGVSQLDDVMPDGGFDRVISTGMFPSLPLSIMMRVQEEGYAVLPIENDGRSMLQLIQHHGEGELMAQWVACWDVEPWPEDVLVAFETGADVEPFDTTTEERFANERAWCRANSVPTRDRFGPARMLDMVERVWYSIDPVHSDVPEGESGGFREQISDDLFRMGHVLLQMGIFELASEHQGEAFR
jgi:protein-L-isoaspartate O-methyltransferase